MFRTVLKNTSYLFAYQVLNKLLFIILTILIARYLGPMTLGEYAFAFAFEYFMLFWVELVSRDLLVREFSRNKNSVPLVIGNVMLFNLALLFTALPIVMLVSKSFSDSNTLHALLFLVWLDAFMVSFTTLFTSVFRAYEKMHYEAITYLIQDTATVILSVLLILKGFGVIHIVSMFVVGKIISFIYSSLIMFKRFPLPSFNIEIGLFKKLVCKSIPFVINGILLFVLYRTDILILGFMKGSSAVGIYAAGCAIITNLAVLSSTFLAALFPLLSRLHEQDKTKIYVTYKKAFKYMLAFNILVSSTIIILSKTIVNLLYGPLFSGTVSILPILSMGGFFMSMAALNTTLLNAVRKEFKNVAFIGCATILNIILNITLIPKWGYNGAAIATFTAYLALFTVQMAYTIKLLRRC
jgi:O-antigen/teichoic acid export membrane protein